MSLSETSLFVARATIPSADAVVQEVAKAGYAIAFPNGFSLSDHTHSFWLPVTVNDVPSGFDYHVGLREDFVGDDPEAPTYPEFGDVVLSFVARGDRSSILAVMLVQRAICQLSPAQGWWEEGEEKLSNKEMIQFCTGSIKDIEANPAQHAPAPSQSKAQSRFPENYFRNVGAALLLAIAVFGGMWLFSVILGYFFGQKAG